MLEIKRSRYFHYLCLFHISSVIIGMTITSRIIDIKYSAYDHFYITGGVFFIPFVFFIQDIATEVYGYTQAKKMLLSTIISFIFYIVSMQTISTYFCANSDSFSIVAEALPRHTVSFVFSLLLGGTANNYILYKLKMAFNSRFLSIRFISSTFLGEAIFQVTAVLISWYGTYSIKTIIPLALASYIYKILFEVAATPVNIYACRYLKSIEQLKT